MLLYANFKLEPLIILLNFRVFSYLMFSARYVLSSHCQFLKAQVPCTRLQSS